MTAAPPRAPIVCVEGPSAVGKTTLAATLARVAGAAVVPELDASGAPPAAESAGWFAERHAERWQRARALAAGAPLVVIDGDPFKGLWYGPVYATDGWPGVDAVASAYRAHVDRGALAVPDLYVLLDAAEDELRRRRAGDATRARRNFEKHLRLAAPLRRHFAALAGAGVARVLRLERGGPDALAAAVLAAVERPPPRPPDARRLLALAGARPGGGEGG